ncbi:hypothetical protein [Chengkuizengella marina]|uniref:Uncharacterized protein n=1 Tax=Chengkuizengella marina TaxID=2507566 RepID=A0A6N9PXK1_9BACL|nr:hypothetical protein [Chengkuizengella marina]NBI28241.1 hypothetical protein [Chengkuizengella marina]
MASKKASKKGFSRIAAITLVLFILLVIILVAAIGRSRYGSGGSIDFTNPEDLIEFTRDLDTFSEMEAFAARLEAFRQGTIQSPLQQFG